MNVKPVFITSRWALDIEGNIVFADSIAAVICDVETVTDEKGQPFEICVTKIYLDSGCLRFEEPLLTLEKVVEALRKCE